MAKANRGIFKMGLVGRPPSFVWQNFMSQLPQIMQRRPIGGLSLEDLHETYQHCNALRKSIQALVDYIFLRGYKWVKAWSRQCIKCSKQYPEKAQPDFCGQCGASDTVDLVSGRILPWYIEPDEGVTKRADKFFRAVDKNGSTLMQASRMAHKHLQWADDMFIIVRQDYDLYQFDVPARLEPMSGVELEPAHSAGDIQKRYIIPTKDAMGAVRQGEIFIADPRTFKVVQHPLTNQPGGLFFICLAHRPTRDPITGTMKGTVHKAPGRCNEPGCNFVLHDAPFVGTEPSAYDKPVEYYIKDEVIWEKMYGITYGYGESQVVPIFNMAQCLIYMERFMSTFYIEERAPRSVLWIPTRNPDMVKSSFKEAEDKNVAAGGHYIPKITFDPGESGSALPTLMELSKLPEELQYLEVRDEFYRRIGAAFDVAPVFHGNVDAVGLQSQGPTQWQVTVLGAQKNQSLWNDKIFPKLLELMDIKDWEMELEEPEEKDEAEEWQNKNLEASYALSMQALGYPAQSRDVEGHFIFPQHPVAQLPPGPMGGTGFGQPSPTSNPPPPKQQAAPGTSFSNGGNGGHA